MAGICLVRGQRMGSAGLEATAEKSLFSANQTPRL